MADTDKKNPKHKNSRRKASCFLSCFGFSDRDDHKYLPEIVVTDDRKKSRRWYMCTSCRLKNSVKETISVYNPPMFKKIESKKQVKEVKFVDKVVDKRQIPVVVDRKPDRVAVVPDQTHGADEKPKKEKYGTTTQYKIHDSRKLQTDTCHKKITDIRRSTLPKAHSQPDSPVKKLSKEIILSHSLSFPRTDRPKSTLAVGHFPVVGQKPGGEVVGNFGPVTGMSVLIVALAIMLLSGRVSAILGTAAWLYFVQYFKTRAIQPKKKIEIIKSNTVNMSFDSKEYKKKVVLEGLLERKHQWSLK